MVLGIILYVFMQQSENFLNVSNTLTLKQIF